MSLPTPIVRPYAVSGLFLELVDLGNDPRPFLEPDMNAGLHIRPQFGAGLDFGGRNGGVWLELLHSLGGGVSYTSYNVGLTSRGPKANSGRLAASVFASRITPMSRSYSPDDDFRGYALSIDVPAPIPFGEAIRLSLGIDYVKFGAFSTGVIHVLGGAVADLARTKNGVLAVHWSPQIGVSIFAEPAGSPPYPMVALGLDARLTFGGVGLSGGLVASGSNGPEGFFPGLTIRIGIVAGR